MKAYKKKLNKEIDFELKAKTFANKNKKASKQKASSNKEVRIKAGGSQKKKNGKYIRRVRGARRYRTLQVMADSRTAAVVAAAAAANCINITVITGTTNGT